MISFVIKRRNPVLEAVPAPIQHGGGALFSRINARRLQQQNPALSPPVSLNGTPLIDSSKIEQQTGIHPIGMGKIEYAKWLTNFVYSKFPKGSWVTLANQPFVLNNLPAVVFEVMDHQELHYCAQYDKETRQPKCIAIQNKDYGSNFPIYYPPALLRPLQPEEVQLLDSLRNQKSDGRDDPSTKLDGTEESVDRSTGETS